VPGLIRARAAVRRWRSGDVVRIALAPGSPGGRAVAVTGRTHGVAPTVETPAGEPVAGALELDPDGRFAGWLDLSALEPGVHRLAVRAGAATTTLAVERGTGGPALHVGRFRADGRIEGLAWSAEAAVTAVEVHLGGARHQALLGLPGPDAAFGAGWEATVDPERIVPGPYAVVARDAAGRAAARIVHTPAPRPGDPEIVLDALVRRAGLVEAAGRVEGSDWIELQGVRAAATLSRPDAPGRERSGFRLRVPDPEPAAPLRVVLRAGATTLERELAPAPSGPVPPPGSEDALRALAEPGEPVLDWEAGIDAGTEPFSPLLDGDALPYADDSVGVVVLGRPGAAARAEAERVARRAVLDLTGDRPESIVFAPRPEPRPPTPRQTTRRALIVTGEPPAFDRDGAAGHALLQARVLRADGFHPVVVAEGATVEDEPRIARLRAEGIEVHAGPHAAGMGESYLAHPDELLAAGGFDLAVLHFWTLAEAWLPRIRHHRPDTPVLVDSIDLHLVRRLRERADHSAVDPADALAVVRELSAYARADGVLNVSDHERALVDRLTGRPGLAHHVPLGRAVEPYEDLPGFEDRQGVLWVGNQRHPPNADALRHLVDDVWPRLEDAVRRTHPLTVAGTGLDRATANELATQPDIRPAGWVPDLLPYLDGARVFCAPLRGGAGVKNKLLDAMMRGLPVVTTPVGIEGMELVPGRDALVADDPAGLAAATRELLEDPERWRALSRAGWERVRDALSLERSEEAFRAAYRAVLGPDRC
jgi:glycosyltransferase involved in cell wall biosynthesis